MPAQRKMIGLMVWQRCKAARLEPCTRPRLQDKKYRCAIGSTSAGAQVSNSPSARTS